MTPVVSARPAVVSRRSLLRRGTLAAVAPLLLACGPPASPAAVRLGIVGIITHDLVDSFRFYRLLGLDLPTSVDAGTTSYRLRMPDDHVLFWETPEVITAFDPTWAAPPPGDRRVVLEFGFDSRAALDSAYEALRAAGAPGRLAPFQQSPSIRYAIVVDPDGNQISLRYPATG